MPNPYDPDAIKRSAQISQLGGQPTSHAETVAPIAGAPPAGWDATNWSDPNMHSVKYDAGRLLYGKTKPSDVGSTVGGADFQKRFPGATFDGKDGLDFHGALSDGDHGSPVGAIDVLMAADKDADTSNGIWWGAPDGTPAQGPAAQGGPAGIDPRADNSALARIMAELSAASEDDQSPAAREAILQMLEGGI